MNVHGRLGKVKFGKPKKIEGRREKTEGQIALSLDLPALRILADAKKTRLVEGEMCTVVAD